MTQKKLEAVRDVIRRTRDELEALRALKFNRAGVAAKLDATVADWLAKARRIGAVNAARSSSGDATTFLTVNARVAGIAVAIDLGPIAVLLLGADAVNAAISAHLASVPEGLDDSAKAEKLARLSADLEAAQYEEEGIIRALESEGETVTYRGDADPRFALTWRPKE